MPHRVHFRRLSDSQRASYSLASYRNAVSGEDPHQRGWRESRNGDSVRSHHDHGRLSAVCGIELSVLVRTFRAGRRRAARPAPELCEVEARTVNQPSNRDSAGLSCVRNCKEQDEVLFPVREDDGSCETGAADDDVVRRSRLRGRSEHEDEGRQQKEDESSHTWITSDGCRRSLRTVPVDQRGALADNFKVYARATGPLTIWRSITLPPWLGG